MVIAGLCAGGITEIEGVDYIERGYEEIIQKLRSVGADICSVIVPEPDEEENTIKKIG
jgi:UDP-N-acetylglucosamine 1-carboxyvinyltransferase